MKTEVNPSLHHRDTKSGLCLVLSRESGGWRLYAAPIPHGTDKAPSLTNGNSKLFPDKALHRVLSEAKAAGDREFTLKVNGHLAHFHVRNVEKKLNEIEAIERAEKIRHKRNRRKL